jgi:hypothetical protein
VLAYTGNWPLLLSSRVCQPNEEPNQAVVRRLALEVRLPGSIAISPNGRYAITSPQAAARNNFRVVTDLVSGSSSVVAGAFNGTARQVTDEGTVVTVEPSAVILIDRNGGTRVLQTTWPVSDVIIDRSGKTVVYGTAPRPSSFGSGSIGGRITSVDVATGRETEVVQTGELVRAPSNLSGTSDGASVRYRSDIRRHDGACSFNTTIDSGLPGLAYRFEFPWHNRRGRGFPDAV